MKEKRKVTKTTLKAILNITNLFSFVVIAAAGLIVQFNYHMDRIPYSNLVLGLDRSAWNQLHVIFSILFVVGIVIHLLLNRKAVLYLFNFRDRSMKSKLRLSRQLLILGFLTVLTGFLAYFFKLSGEFENRLHIMEIHDKLAIIFLIISVIHIIQHSGQIISYLKTWNIHRIINLPDEAIK